MVKDMVLHLERKHIGGPPTPLGKSWVSQFLRRHPRLAIKLSTQVEGQCVYVNDPDIL